MTITPIPPKPEAVTAFSLVYIEPTERQKTYASRVALSCNGVYESNPGALRFELVWSDKSGKYNGLLSLATVNVNKVPEKDCLIIKSWEENKGLYETLLKSGLIEIMVVNLHVHASGNVAFEVKCKGRLLQCVRDAQEVYNTGRYQK